MPYNDDVMGIPRRFWVRRCLKAIIAVTTPGSRFLILRGGFLKFEPLARGAFKELAGFAITSREIRDVWDGLGKYVHRNERHLQRKLEKLYEKDRKTMSADARPDGSYDGSNPGIVVETADKGVVH